MLSSYPNPQEFRFNTKGEYHDFPTTPVMRRKKMIKRESGPGMVCPSCGLTRSAMNKCDCNS